MRLRFAVLCTVVLLAAPAFALESYLVKDINPVPQNQSSNPRSFIPLDNGISLFVADREPYDPELWRSDGTAAGTYQLTDTCATWSCSSALIGVALAGDRFFYLAATQPGEGARELWVTSGSPGDTVDLGVSLRLDQYNVPVWVKSLGLVFFVDGDGALWRSDGTPGGTYKFLIRGVLGDLVELRGRLYFRGPGTKRNRQALWTSDGTPQGTRLVKDVPPAYLRSIGSALVFFGPGSSTSASLWRSDGTAKGTVQIATIRVSAKDGDWLPLDLVALAGRYYFTARIKGQGEELWASDGTPAGTRRLTNFANDVVFHYEDYEPLYLPGVAAGSWMVFAADDGAHGAEPWITNGTPAGTRLLRDLCPGPCGSYPAALSPFGSRLMFAARGSGTGDEPWITDGTKAGTRLIRDLCPGTCWGYPFGVRELNGRLIFGAYDSQKFQLWRSDGTARGTAPITALPVELGRVGTLIPGALLFAAHSPQDGLELWRTDGTAAGTGLVLDLVDKDNGGGRPSSLFALGSNLLFLADDGLHGRELWTSDGTEEGTRLVRDTPPYPQGGERTYIAGWAEMGGSAYWTGETSEGNGLWRTDGTEAGTHRLTPEGASATRWVKAVGQRVFFPGYDEEHGFELWTSDGTVAGTRTLDLSPGSAWSNPERPIAFKNHLYVSANGIWKSDGTPEGTEKASIFSSHSPVLLGEFGGRLWFTSATEGLGRELWSTDGTEQGTRILADLVPGEGSFEVMDLKAAGSRMFLAVKEELWVSDGTAAATRRVAAAPKIELRALLGGTLFYTADGDGDHSSELWLSDGTDAGTRPVLDAEGKTFENVQTLVPFGGRIWFSREGKLWRTDGSAAGTIEVAADLSRDPWSFELVPAGNRLFYPGWTAQIGHELWAVEPQ